MGRPPFGPRLEKLKEVHPSRAENFIVYRYIIPYHDGNKVDTRWLVTVPVHVGLSRGEVRVVGLDFFVGARLCAGGGVCVAPDVNLLSTPPFDHRCSSHRDGGARSEHQRC